MNMAENREDREKPGLDEVPDVDASKYNSWSVTQVFTFFTKRMRNKHTEEDIKAVLRKLLNGTTMGISSI